jgi:hypothetical protein
MADQPLHSSNPVETYLSVADHVARIREIRNEIQGTIAISRATLAESFRLLARADQILAKH